MSETYGYIRVSSKDQNLMRQLLAMEKNSVPASNIYMDKQSGQSFKRPQYQKLLNRLRCGDLLYVMSIDRLGRNYEEIQNQWRLLTKELEVDICVLDMPLLDTRNGRDLLGTFIADLVLQILSFVAHKEREDIRTRQAQGIQAARDRGVQFGRPPCPTPAPDLFLEIVNDWQNKELLLPDALDQLAISRSTFFRRLRKLR